MSTTERLQNGARRIYLFVPFVHPQNLNITIDSITFQPVDFDTVMRWEAGEIEDGVIGLMSELSGWHPFILGKLKYPDAGFVMDEFMMHLPQSMKDSIMRGEMPTISGIKPVTSARPDMPQPGDPAYDPTFQGTVAAIAQSDAPKRFPDAHPKPRYLPPDPAAWPANTPGREELLKSTGLIPGNPPPEVAKVVPVHPDTPSAPLVSGSGLDLSDNG